MLERKQPSFCFLLGLTSRIRTLIRSDLVIDLFFGKTVIGQWSESPNGERQFGSL